MLIHKTNLKARDVKVTSRNIEIMFLDGVDPLVLELPSAEELEHLRDGYEYKISYPEIAQYDIFNLKEKYQYEIDRLLEKYKKYEGSSSYLVGLSNLSELVGKDEDARKYLEEAGKRDDSNYIKHEIGSILINSGSTEEAYNHFLSLDLENDAYANLRLAYFSVVNNEIEEAEAHVKKAIEIDESSYSSRLFYGAICLWKKDHEQAVLNYKIATEINQYSSVGFFNLAAAYWGLGLKQKAHSALKRSIIIDPFNENAVSFYSDASFIMGNGKINDSIPVLKKYLQYDQKAERIWALLGRAYYTLGRDKKSNTLLHDSLQSLRHQESLSSTSGVWNNIGLVAWRLSDYKAAQRYLNLSLKKAIENENNIALPLYNICGLMIDTHSYAEALKILESCIMLVDPDEDKYNLLDKIRLQHVLLLEGVKQRSKALDHALEYLSQGCRDMEVKLDLMIRVVHYYTVYKPDLGVIEQYRNDIFELFDSVDIKSIEFNKLKERVINNLAFAYLNFDKLDDASKIINKLSNSFHNEPYATATLGLFNIKKGLYEKGIELYEEAIRLLHARKPKRRFRQRLNYELGKAYLKDGDIRKALRWLKKAADEKDGYTYVNTGASDLIKSTMLIDGKK